MSFDDDATAAEELFRAVDLANSRKRADALQAVKKCHNCATRLPAGVRFCDADCRDDYGKREAARIRRGGV